MMDERPLQVAERDAAEGSSAPVDEELAAEEANETSRPLSQRSRQTFTWRQKSVLEQVFEVCPFPHPV